MPSPSGVHSNIPSVIYSSLPELVPKMLLSGMPSSSHSDTLNDTPSLEPSSYSSFD